MLPILALLAAPAADASSDIEFKTSGPVLIYVSGQQAALNSKMRQRVSGLEPGTHEVRVTGVFGKTLYEADIEVPDNTMTWAEWDRGELKIVRTEWLDEAEAEEEEEEEVVAIAESEPEPEPEPEPEVVTVADPPAVVEEEIALAVPVDQATSLPTPSTGRTLTVQASDGMRVNVVANGQHLIVVVENGGFRIVDPSGLEFALGE